LKGLRQYWFQMFRLTFLKQSFYGISPTKLRFCNFRKHWYLTLWACHKRIAFLALDLFKNLLLFFWHVILSQNFFIHLLYPQSLQDHFYLRKYYRELNILSSKYLADASSLKLCNIIYSKLENPIEENIDWDHLNILLAIVIRQNTDNLRNVKNRGYCPSVWMHLVRQFLKHFGCDIDLLFLGDWLTLRFLTLIVAIVVCYLAWWHTFLNSSLHSYWHVVKLAVVQVICLRCGLVLAYFLIEKRNITCVIFFYVFMTVVKFRVDFIPFFWYDVFVKFFWVILAFWNLCRRVFFLTFWLWLLFILFLMSHVFCC
jgi:hypothetical protein